MIAALLNRLMGVRCLFAIGLDSLLVLISDAKVIINHRPQKC